MAAPPPPAADQHDYQALLCSLLELHLFPLLDRADKLAVRGVSVQLRDEAGRCFRSLDCPPTLKTKRGAQRLQALLGRLVGLRSLTLRSLEAVGAVFSDDGSHVCSPRLEDLAIKLSMVSPSPLRAHVIKGEAPRTACRIPACADPSLKLPCRMTQQG
jgi:hypothetical protein